MKNKYLIILKNAVTVILTAVLMALSYTLFVFPNKFAPAGINGIATILQYLNVINVSNINIIINIPLCIIAFFYINKEYAVNSLLYTVSFSIGLDIFARTESLKQFIYSSNGTGGAILATVCAGVISGFIYSLTQNSNASTGGTQIIAMCINKRRPQFNMFWSMFFLNASVAVVSFFVFGYNYDPVFLCVLYCFTSTYVGNMVSAGAKKAIRFEIISDEYKEISREIIEELHHSATLIDGRGIYSDDKRPVLICIINRVQLPKMHKIIKRHKNTFAFSSEVNEVYGNYKYRVR